VRAVLDTNVVISAVLSPNGAPARVMQAWLGGGFELVASEMLLEELGRALRYSKLARRIDPDSASELVAIVRAGAVLIVDPAGSVPARSPDPGDDYLIALAVAARAVIVSGDNHLLSLRGEIPVYSPAEFLRLIE
jgi:putative PIN family toxin of toxin-antitoxin system